MDDPAPTVAVDRVPVGSTHVRLRSVAAPGARAIVLVTGLGVPASALERLAPALTEFGPVHALDLPGFAGVPRFRGRVSIERYADAVEQVVDALGLDDPVLVGHSSGAQIVTEVAARRPDLSRVVLVSPVVDPEARTWSESVVRFLRASVHEPATVRVQATSAYVLSGWYWLVRVLPRMLRYRIEERGAAIAAHVLVIRGSEDALVTRQWVRTIARALPHATLREVVGGAHSLVHAEADVVARLVVEHARGGLADRGVASLQRVRDTTEPVAERLSLGDASRIVWARLRGLVGVSRHDDRVAPAETDPAAVAADASAPTAVAASAEHDADAA